MVGYEDVTRKPSIFLLAHSQKESKVHPAESALHIKFAFFTAVLP